MDAQPIVWLPLADTAALFAAVRSLGLGVAVLTADDRAPTAAFLAQEGVQDGVPAVCGNDGRGHKPHAAPLRALARDLGVPPESLVMVGDSAHDVACGVAAGAWSVGVLSGVGTAEVLACADAVVPDVTHLPALLARWLGKADVGGSPGSGPRA